MDKSHIETEPQIEGSFQKTLEAWDQTHNHNLQQINRFMPKYLLHKAVSLNVPWTKMEYNSEKKKKKKHGSSSLSYPHRQMTLQMEMCQKQLNSVKLLLQSKHSSAIPVKSVSFATQCGPSEKSYGKK